MFQNCGPKFLAAIAGLQIVLVAWIVSSCADPRRDERRITELPYKTFVGLTGSMRPFFNGGEPITIEPIAFDEIKVGDLIVYWDYKRRLNVLHRVVAIRQSAMEPFLVMQGDAIPAPDEFRVGKADVIGIARLGH